MKISNEELKQIIKEELEIVLNEAFGLRHLALGPMGGTLYGAMKGKRKSVEDPERPLYRRGGYESDADYEKRQAREAEEAIEAERLEAQRQREENYPIQIADILSQQGIIAIPEGSGIKIKGIINPDGTSRSGRDAKLYAQVNTDLSLEEAAADVIDQIRGRDPEAMRRSSRKMMRQGRSSINIDDPMMEGKKRRIKRKR